MGILAPTPNRVTVTGRASVDSGTWLLTLPDEEDVPTIFYAQIGNRVGGRGLTSPRERAQVWLRYPVGALVEEPPAPGSTLEIDGVAFEVCEDSGVLSIGVRTAGYELQVVEVARAYPTEVAILDSSGDVIENEVRIAMWTPKESHDDRGERVDEQGEAPASLFGVLVPRNTMITAGSTTWRITACTLDRDLGRVLLTLRNTRGED